MSKEPPLRREQSEGVVNPISKVRTSSKALREKDVLTPEEFHALLGELSVRDRAMVLLAGSTAVHRSELMALTWSDLDLQAMAVNITKSCVRNRFGNTKTDASRCPIPLHPLVLKALYDWKRDANSRLEELLLPGRVFNAQHL